MNDKQILCCVIAFIAFALIVLIAACAGGLTHELTTAAIGKTCIKAGGSWINIGGELQCFASRKTSGE